MVLKRIATGAKWTLIAFLLFELSQIIIGVTIVAPIILESTGQLEEIKGAIDAAMSH